MSKTNKRIIIVFFIALVFFVGGKFFVANRSDILLNYNENSYEYTDFLVETEGKFSMSAYFVIDEDYYKYNESKSKEWIKEDLRVKKLGNEYCEPRIEILKSIKNLEKTDSPTSTTPDLSMSFTIQKDKMFDKETWNYYEGKVSVYLKDNIISVDKFGIKSDRYYIPQKTKYYILNDRMKGNINKVLEQVTNESEQ